jgi:hypothetical protein
MTESTLIKDQKLTFRKQISDWESITATVRFDDRCGNGHNTFSITGECRVYSRVESCGCLHDLIAEYFPELAPLIKWHLCSSDGPLHYIANTVFHASNRDCWGTRKGEQRTDKTGRPMWQFNGPGRRIQSSNRPINCGEWVPVTGEGKERNLDAARQAAIWPDATDEELTSPELPDLLRARLPELLTDFRRAVESLGLKW